jgi:endonuclease III
MPALTPLPLAQILETLEAHYGRHTPVWPTDPYQFLVWWHCGYPASDLTCSKGWESLTRLVGVEPERILAANPSKLAAALKPGGMVPELRGKRLKEVAERVQKEFGGDLAAAFRAMPIAKVRAALKKFPNIADPGADRILLFGGISPVAAVPSNCTQVLVRIRLGQEHENYGRTYKEAQEIIAAESLVNFDSRTRAYLLLKRHGQHLCKRTNPKCSDCPVSAACAFFSGKMRGRLTPGKR